MNGRWKAKITEVAKGVSCFRLEKIYSKENKGLVANLPGETWLVFHEMAGNGPKVKDTATDNRNNLVQLK